MSQRVSGVSKGSPADFARWDPPFEWAWVPGRGSGTRDGVQRAGEYGAVPADEQGYGQVGHDPGPCHIHPSGGPHDHVTRVVGAGVPVYA
ncbi:unnamed protein product [Boreogadus saida]